MIAPASLSAFTPALSPSTSATRVSAPSATRAAQAAPVQKPLQATPGSSPPARATPRGALLDLSV